MAETNVAETVVEYLSSKGVRHVFGVLAHTSFAIGAPIRMAALLVSLGLKQSRTRWPKSRN